MTNSRSMIFFSLALAVFSQGTSAEEQNVLPDTISFAHSFNETDPFFRTIIKPWAYEIEARSEGTLVFEFRQVETTGLTTLEAGTDIIFFQPKLIESRGIEALTHLSTVSAGLSSSETSQALWQTHLEFSDKLDDVYGMAEPIGFVAFGNLDFYSTNYVPHLSHGELGTEVLKNAKTQAHILVSASEAVDLFIETPIEASFSPTEGSSGSLGRSSGVLLASQSMFERFPASTREIFLVDSPSVLADLAGSIEERSEAAADLFSRVGSSTEASELTIKMEELMALRDDTVANSLELNGVNSSKAIDFFAEQVRTHSRDGEASLWK